MTNSEYDASASEIVGGERNGNAESRKSINTELFIDREVKLFIKK